MPELDSPYGYPLVIVTALVIAVASLLYFKKKKCAERRKYKS